VGVFIPNSSPVVETIERGLTYRGKSFVVDDWYLSAYQPIFVESELKGMLFVGVKLLNRKLLKELFSINSLHNLAYPYLISKEGKFIIHPERENENIGQTLFFRQFQRSVSKVKFIKYQSIENDFNVDAGTTDFRPSQKYLSNYFGKNKAGKWFYDFYKFDNYTENFIVVSLEEEQLLQRVVHFRNDFILVGIITILVLIISVTFIVKPISNQIKEVVEVAAQMSKGHLVDKVVITNQTEIGQIAISINSLIAGMSWYAEFAKEIGKGNLTAKFTPLSDYDVLGNSLIKMRDDLYHSQKEREERQKEDEKQKWVSDGLSLFNEILRLYHDDIKKLSYAIISAFVKYIGANQAGLFLKNDTDKSDIYLELIATYAFNRERNLQKRIPYGVGLMGRCVLEKKILYFTEIPQNYVSITSGLGQHNPNCLILIPLKDNEEILGLIEVASFTKMDNTQMQFIQKVSESIAKTLSTVKINAQTSVLLHKSQQQSEELAAQEEEMRQNLEELQATQEASARRETELRGLLNALHLSTLVIEYDMDGNILNINDAFLSLMGIQREQLIGKNQDIFIIENERIEYQNLRERLNAGDTIKKTTHFTYLNLDMWLSETFTPILDEEGIPYKFIDIAVDITDNVNRENLLNSQTLEMETREQQLNDTLQKIEQIQNENARKEAEKNSILKALYESTLIAEYGLDGELLNMNDGFLELFEVTRDQIVGCFHRDFTSMNENSLAYKKFWDDIKSGKTRIVDEHIKLSSGKRFWISQTYTPILDEGGNPHKVLNIAVDITAKKIPWEKL
jgi:methyl-accepting chemotaxis protein